MKCTVYRYIFTKYKADLEDQFILACILGDKDQQRHLQTTIEHFIAQVAVHEELCDNKKDSLCIFYTTLHSPSNSVDIDPKMSESSSPQSPQA